MQGKSIGRQETADEAFPESGPQRFFHDYLVIDIREDCLGKCPAAQGIVEILLINIPELFPGVVAVGVEYFAALETGHDRFDPAVELDE